MVPPGGSEGAGLHWFRIHFEDSKGRCFITTDEAQQLRQLTTNWVRRALENLGAQRGQRWVKSTANSKSGLMLHSSDAYDFSPSARRIRRPV